jgi:hypothetical protein
MATEHFDVVIVGASFGGVAAALAAASDPKVRVVLLEAGQWVGGQATSQGVTRWDEAENALTEAGGSTKSYRDVRNAIRTHYRDGDDLSAVGREQRFFNPGFARTGPPFQQGSSRKGHPFSADPRLVETILRDELRKLETRLDVRFGAVVTGADVRDGTIRSLTVRTGSATDTLVATQYLDATDLGDLLPICGVPFRIGAEAKSEFGEPDALPAERPDFIQALTVPIAMERRPEHERHTLPKPARYEEIRDRQGFGVVDGDIGFVFRSKVAEDGDSLWNYRRYIDAENFTGLNDRTTINMKYNDFRDRTLPTGSPAQDAQVVADARAVSIAYAFYLQTEVKRDDGNGKGYPNLMVVDAFGTGDGTAPAPYVRESRRLRNPLSRVVEQDILDDRADPLPRTDPIRAEPMDDTCGIGWYNLDVHPTAIPGFNEINRAAKPFQIPLGALIPETPDNLIAACKNIGTTHITSGAYRVHPVEWAIGEAAGTLAAFCVTQSVTPNEVNSSEPRRLAYQTRLLERGVPIFWWGDVIIEDGRQRFVAIHMLGVHGVLSGVEHLGFDPHGAVDDAFKRAVEEHAGPLRWPPPEQIPTRADGAVFAAKALGLPVGDPAGSP